MELICGTNRKTAGTGVGTILDRWNGPVDRGKGRIEDVPAVNFAVNVPAVRNFLDVNGCCIQIFIADDSCMQLVDIYTTKRVKSPNMKKKYAVSNEKRCDNSSVVSNDGQ